MVMAHCFARRRARRAVVLRLECLDARQLLNAGGPLYPQDPQFALEWGLNNPSDVDIDAPEAWATTTGSASTIVAVLDSGIDLNNSEFAGRLWLNPRASRPGKPVYGWNFVDKNGNVQDDYGHGTHVAGILGASNDGRGIVGVDWNARIMPLKVLNSRGEGTVEDTVAAIHFAVDNGARVINASWSIDEPDPSLYNAIVHAESKGVVFVASAGNGGANLDANPTYPAAYRLPNVIVVGAVDSSGNLADFSNHGATTVDVAAPGVDIHSVYASRTGYATLSGTSMAAPHVSGVVSLLVGLHPEWSAQQLVQRVLTTTKPLPGLDGKTITGGIVSAAGAVGVPGSGLDDNRHVAPPPAAPRAIAQSATLAPMARAPMTRAPIARAPVSRPRPAPPPVRAPIRRPPVPQRALPPRLARALPAMPFRLRAASLGAEPIGLAL